MCVCVCVCVCLYVCVRVRVYVCVCLQPYPQNLPHYLRGSSNFDYKDQMRRCTAWTDECLASEIAKSQNSKFET
jgi:hypothetical protein